MTSKKKSSKSYTMKATVKATPILQAKVERVPESTEYGFTYGPMEACLPKPASFCAEMGFPEDAGLPKAPEPVSLTEMFEG